MNQLNAVGNIGKDAETRYLPDGTAVASWSLAIKSGYGDKAVTTWLNCSLFGKRVASLVPYIKKGAQLGITGEIQLREYTTKDGAVKSSLECRVSEVTLLGSKSGDVHETRTSNKPNVGKPKPETNEQEVDEDSDVPF